MERETERNDKHREEEGRGMITATDSFIDSETVPSPKIPPKRK